MGDTELFLLSVDPALVEWVEIFEEAEIEYAALRQEKFSYRDLKERGLPMELLMKLRTRIKADVTRARNRLEEEIEALAMKAEELQKVVLATIHIWSWRQRSRHS